MKVLNLCCSHEHRFEGWFASEEDYLSQTERRLVECPMCGDLGIKRLPAAPRLNVKAPRESATGHDTPQSPEAMTMQAMWNRAVQHVMANTDDVGERFAEEARRIHYGETPDRAIRGQATSDDAQALRDEGIDVVALKVPRTPPKGTLQ
jgi:hypothetical protein